MNLCDPHCNIVNPVPSTGEQERPPFMPVKCDRCGHTHNLHGDCVVKGYPPVVAVNAMVEMGIDESKARETLFFAIPEPKEIVPSTGTREIETGKIDPFHFNSLSIQHLSQKIDGETEHLFIAFLNGRAVGSVTARIWDDKSCGVRMMFVSPANRGMGIATRLLNSVEILARQESATHLELACNRGNVNARRFWIRRRFVDAPEIEAKPDPIRFICMVKPL